MKELESHKPLQPVTEAVQQQRKAVAIDSMIPHKGHTVYELNLDTTQIKPATFESVNASYNTKAVTKKLVMQENCLYTSALNVTNAEKKFKKIILKMTNHDNS